jgi:EF hand
MVVDTSHAQEIPMRSFVFFILAALIALVPYIDLSSQELASVAVEGQPLAGNVTRLLQALDSLGTPLPAKVVNDLTAALKAQDAAKIQELLDPQVLIAVNINPEARVKAKRGPGPTTLQQTGYTPILLKIINEAGVTKPLHVQSPQALPVYAGGASGKIKEADLKDRFLDVEIFRGNPLTDKLSGLKVEYALALIHASHAGQREAVLQFDVGQGTQELGFRGEVPVLFTIRPAIPVKLVIADVDGKPTTARFTFKDKLGRVYPPKVKRLAPDFFFQDQVYRASGETVLLPPGELTMTYGRGPEYLLRERKITVPDKSEAIEKVAVERWIDPMAYGFYSGDHHIHAAGCAHYTNPTEGVFAPDMFLHVKGEGLNVGCNLTWGPCFDFQRQFFEPTVNKVSEPLTLLKYDIEVSGFGSQLLGHVCLLNLRDQTYPGSNGTTKGWPTWTTPLMRWAKAQGAYTGYAHSANGLTFDNRGIGARALAKRIIAELDANKDGELMLTEAAQGLLPDAFAKIDTNGDGKLTEKELTDHIQRIANTKLPNLAIPPMDGIGAQEICVTSAQGLCDFISAMDTERVPEWNCWYHIMNCGFPLKASGETDFPCITGSRVGQGRVYVQLGKVERIEFKDWAEGLAKGRSYISDGYAHALEFTVQGKKPGDQADLANRGVVTVKAKVAFAASMPLGTAVGGKLPKGKTRLVEIVVNGQAVASKEVPADDQEHDLTFNIPIERSSWIALRHFPQMHTNPVNILVASQPIRASRNSALWCLGTIEQLWRVRANNIAAAERGEANKTFQAAIERYRKIAEECPEGS